MNEAIKRAKIATKDVLKKVLTRRYHIEPKYIFESKRYYIIRRNVPWAGFFSNYLYVLAHLEYSLKKGYIPIIDMENYPTFYNEKAENLGTMNAWEYYFEQPFNIGIEDAYKSGNYILSDISTMGKYLPYKEGNSTFNIDWSKAKQLTKHIEKYMRLKPEISTKINRFVSENMSQYKVLGVHYRGTDKKQKVVDHYLAGSIEAYMRAVKKCINEHNVDKILLCTDEKEAITAFEKEFPGKIFFTDSYRAEPGDTEGIHISKKSKREHHNYLLGLEVLCDTMYLSKCDYLVFSHSNVATAAMFINGNKYDGTYMVED